VQDAANRQGGRKDAKWSVDRLKSRRSLHSISCSPQVAGVYSPITSRALRFFGSADDEIGTFPAINSTTVGEESSGGLDND
jgi:hypothetical protein